MSDERKLRAFIERERLRVWSDAEATLAERLDPEDTMTLFDAIRGHDAELRALYEELLAADTTLAMTEVPT